MKIEVEAQGWGEAIPSNIETLLANVASHLNRLLVVPVVEHIKVIPATGPSAVPRTLYRHGADGPITIQLTAHDTYWAKFSYQFAHEFCHVLSDYERLCDNPNQWFHEALCELASGFTLRCMAERWPTQPPYPNWADYAPALSDYADNLLTDDDHQVPDGQTLATWFPMYEAELRHDPYIRDKNAIVAYQLLPLFEANPSGWNAVRSMPSSTGILTEYLADWHECVQPADKPFVKRVIGAFQ
ncbi:MAG: hypothetical protein OXE87_08175 [Chloroflexi bacterium]|nr:hypothetical protein [Chloroflexota bacterium]